MLAQILYTASQIRYYTWRHDVTMDTLYHIFMSVGNTNRLIVAHWWHLLLLQSILWGSEGGRTPPCIQHFSHHTEILITSDTVPGQSTALAAGVTDAAGVSWAMSTSGLSSHHVSGARTLGTLRRCEIVAPPGAGRDLKVYTTFRGCFHNVRRRHFHTSTLMINY